MLCAMDIKSVLKHVSLDDPKKVFDAGVAAYLLNPLKSSYSHDDIAKEYLDGMMFPLKGRPSWKDFSEKGLGRGTGMPWKLCLLSGVCALHGPKGSS